MIEGSFGVFQGRPSPVKIRFAAAVAGYIEEKVWHHSQTTERWPDGSLIFTAQVAGLEEIKHWVLRWGAAAEVIQPTALRAALAEEARRLNALYTTERRGGQEDG
jgi:predicted DNA-binding transcriptional regulator YafY